MSAVMSNGGERRITRLPDALPAQRALAELVAAVVAEAAAGRVRIGRRGARVAPDDQHVLAELAPRDLEEQAVADRWTANMPRRVFASRVITRS